MTLQEIDSDGFSVVKAKTDLHIDGTSRSVTEMLILKLKGKNCKRLYSSMRFKNGHYSRPQLIDKSLAVSV